MPWCGITLVASGGAVMGYVFGALMSERKWRGLLFDQGQDYHEHVEALTAKAGKFREAYFRAHDRAEAYRAEIARLTARTEDGKST